jgi:hypothetical protein
MTAGVDGELPGASASPRFRWILENTFSSLPLKVFTTSAEGTSNVERLYILRRTPATVV